MRSQLEFQAVVVPMDEPDPSGGLRKIALFNADGTPFTGGTGEAPPPPEGGGNMILTLSRPGLLSEGPDGVGSIRIPVTRDCQIVNMRAMTEIDGEPTDDELIVDINRGNSAADPVSLFTTQSERPTVAIGEYDSGETVPDVVLLSAGDFLTLDVDQHGGASGVTVAIEVA